TGYLSPHRRLLTRVDGGRLTGLAGTDTTLALVASADAQVQDRVGLPQSDHSVTDRETGTITVNYLKDGREKKLAFPFKSGSLPWRADEFLRPHPHPLLVALDWLDH